MVLLLPGTMQNGFRRDTPQERKISWPPVNFAAPPADTVAEGHPLVSPNPGAWTMSEVMTRSPVNVEEGLARAGQDREFFKELLEMLAEDAPAKLADIRALVSAGRTAEIVGPAHSLKGAAANLSAVGVHGVAKAIELAAREGRLEESAALVPELEEQVARLLAFVREFEA